MVRLVMFIMITTVRLKVGILRLVSVMINLGFRTIKKKMVVFGVLCIFCYLFLSHINNFRGSGGGQKQFINIENSYQIHLEHQKLPEKDIFVNHCDLGVNVNIYPMKGVHK